MSLKLKDEQLFQNYKKIWEQIERLINGDKF